MKECFITKEFTPRVLAIIEQANVIIAEYTAQGYDLSVRQLYYQFVARALLANTPRNYENLAAVISDARDAGLVDWAAIKDRHRVTQSVSTFDNIKGYLQQLNERYRRDKWRDQPCYVEVMVEKMALEGVLQPICDRWDVPFTANKGYSSSTSMYERGKWLQSKRDVEHKDVHVIYLGDHDPSGVDMSRDVLERLSLYSDGPVRVHRVALNMDQIEEHRPPENPAKVDDSRAAAYIERYGTSSWELDALEPALLASLVESKIRELVDHARWERGLTTQEDEQGKLQDIIETL